MATLPSDVGTGIIRVRLRKVGLVSSDLQNTDVDAITGKVIFTPSASMLRHVGQGLMFPAYPVTAYLNAKGDADVQLMATDDAQITPVGWTYTVSFVLDDAININSFSISVPEGSDRELSDLTPVADNTGTFYLNVGPAGPTGPASTVPGPTGPQGPAGTVDATAVAGVLGVTLVVQDTPPASATSLGKPVVWVQANSILTAVPVTPTVPSYDFTAFTVTAPSLTGVQYQIVESGTGNIVDLVNGVATSVSAYTRPYILTVRAIAKPGYVLTAAYSWDRLLIDSSTLANYANDSFAGTSGAQLATGNNASQRTWDMVGGGSASPAPVWYTNTGAGVAGGLQIHTTGTAAVKSTGSGVDTSHVENYFNVGAANFEVDVVLNGYLVEHSQAFNCYVGATTSTGTNQVTCQLYYDSGVGLIVRFGASGTVAQQDNTWRNTSVVEATILGTWKFVWVNKVMQVTAPDAQVYSRNFTSSGITYGNWGGIGVSDFNTRTRWPMLDSIKVLR